MEVFVSKKFKKTFKKCSLEIQQKIFEKLKTLEANKTDPDLNNHPLTGKLKELRSINISGD